MIPSVRYSRPSLSASRLHHILFYSPVLGRLVVPFSVQSDLFQVVEKMESVGSASNTHTKPRNPGVNTLIRS